MTDQLQLLPPDYADPVDTRSQVTRMPGTVAAPCLCTKTRCMWPFCKFPRPKEDE